MPTFTKVLKGGILLGLGLATLVFSYRLFMGLIPVFHKEAYITVPMEINHSPDRLVLEITINDTDRVRLRDRWDALSRLLPEEVQIRPSTHWTRHGNRSVKVYALHIRAYLNSKEKLRWEDIMAYTDSLYGYYTSTQPHWQNLSNQMEERAKQILQMKAKERLRSAFWIPFFFYMDDWDVQCGGSVYSPMLMAAKNGASSEGISPSPGVIPTTCVARAHIHMIGIIWGETDGHGRVVGVP